MSRELQIRGSLLLDSSIVEVDVYDQRQSWTTRTRSLSYVVSSRKNDNSERRQSAYRKRQSADWNRTPFSGFSIDVTALCHSPFKLKPMRH